MESYDKSAQAFPIAIGQLPISGDARKNGAQVRELMQQAAEKGARLIQFPEGMLSGYAKSPIQDWAEVDWQIVRAESEAIQQLAARLGLWVVLGSAHPLTPPNWPHNSMYIISDQGEIVTRYDKRICSFTEVSRFYTAGYEPVIFDVDGFRFGCIICVEINFPELFIEYGRLGVDCILLSAFPVDEIFYLKARAYAAIHNCWISLSVPSDTIHLMQSTLIGPDGMAQQAMTDSKGFVHGLLDRNDPALDIALNKARPWRASIAHDKRYQTRALNDPRSLNRTCV